MAKASKDNRVYLAVIALLALAVIALGLLLFLSVRDDVVATVNGEAIKKDELFEAMYAQDGKEALDNIIMRKLIAQEGASAGIEVSEEELDLEIKSIIDESFQGSEDTFRLILQGYGIKYDSFRNDAKLNLLIRKIAESRIEVTDEEIRQFYEDNTVLFDHFANLASEHSIDKSNKDRGGYLGFLGRGMTVEEFERVAFTIPVGAVSEPVLTDFGYHLIHVLDRDTEEEIVTARHILVETEEEAREILEILRDAVDKEIVYEEIQEKARQALIEAKVSPFINQLVETLYENAEIEYKL